jgi:hypothetical protein
MPEPGGKKGISEIPNLVLNPLIEHMGNDHIHTSHMYKLIVESIKSQNNIFRLQNLRVGTYCTPWQAVLLPLAQPKVPFHETL